MRGIAISPDVAAKARAMRASGEKTLAIAKALGVSDGWVSKVCKGINTGQRSRFDHLNRIDVAAIVRAMVSEGATDKAIAERLSVSTGFAAFLRRKHFGHKPRSALHADKVAELLLQGAPARQISDENGVAVATVRAVAAKRGIALPPAKRVNNTARQMLPDLGYFQERFTYDPATGVILKDGAKIGSVLNGYLRISTRGRQYQAHRVAWLMHFQEEPPAIIDHSDADPLNNRISNLRSADWSCNAFNRKLDKRNTTGVKGVYRMKGGRYRAIVQAYGAVYCAESGDLASARKTRQRLAEQMHGEFVRHG